MSLKLMRGVLSDVLDLKRLLSSFPSATFFMVMDDYNELTHIAAMGLFIESESKQGSAYIIDADVTQILPALITKKLYITGSRIIGFNDFLDYGQELANSMKRGVTLIHLINTGEGLKVENLRMRYNPL